MPPVSKKRGQAKRDSRALVATTLMSCARVPATIAAKPASLIRPDLQGQDAAVGGAVSGASGSRRGARLERSPSLHPRAREGRRVERRDLDATGGARHVHDLAPA